VAQRRLEPTEVVLEEPEWFKAAEPFQREDEIRAAPKARPPAQPPLMRWSRLWPFLKTALSVQQTTQALDIPRIIERLARLRALQYLPRRQHLGWASNCQLIIDYAEPLLPFWTDFKQLRRRLRNLRGQLGLTVITLRDGDASGRYGVLMGVDEWLTGHYPLPKAGTAVLVLSDLGCIDKTDWRRRQWQQLGERLRRAGCRPVALLPCPPRWWDSELTRLFYPVCWDRAVRPPPRIGLRQPLAPAVERGKSDSGAKQLLALLAPAIRVEPTLLRAARYRLPAGQCDVGSEAAAWNHPQVHPTPLAFYYDREAIVAYRRAFQYEDANLRHDIAMLIMEHHADLSPTITYEERCLIANLEGRDDQEARQFMTRMLKTLYPQQSGVIADAIAAWVGRLAPRQHEAMQENHVLAAMVGLVHLRQGKLPPAWVDLWKISWLLGGGQTLRRYTLRQRGQALYFTNQADTSGSPVAEIEATAPHVQIRRIMADGTAYDEPIQPFDQLIQLHPDECLRVRTDRRELVIDSTTRPDWAEAIGRDKYGLYADFRIQGVSQRMRWILPGEFMMGSPQNEANRFYNENQHRVTLSRGFWLADTVCTQALWQVVMGQNPSFFKGEDQPVERVSWDGVQRFIERLNGLILDGKFRLPTEAEWEYTCRAGTITAFWFGDQITPEQVNYHGNYPYAGGRKGKYRKETVEVKELPCNNWGLYQMHGNVWEWCQDRYAAYPPGAVTDPVEPTKGKGRVLRGGSWFSYGRYARSAYRFHGDPAFFDYRLGFRLARGKAPGQG
jgi:formylglycine-generating enzyme required for sulfatase activity